MDMTNEEADAIIKEILDKFDFEKVHAVMVLTDWKWKEIRVPTVEELRECAGWLLVNACFAEGDYTSGLGGLAVYKDDREVNLVFELETCAVERGNND